MEKNKKAFQSSAMGFGEEWRGELQYSKSRMQKKK
jgi:hypothetical protein